MVSKVYGEFKIPKIKWWEILLLWFKKPYIGVDVGQEKDTCVVVKYLFDKIYVVEEYEVVKGRK